MSKTTITWGLIIIALLITGMLIAKCVRNKETNKHTEVRLDIVNKDILETSKANLYRDSIKTLKLALLTKSKKNEYIYLPIKIKAEEAVKEYDKKPTIDNCSTAVAVLRVKSVVADSLMGDLKQINTLNDTLIASLGRTINKKDKAISDLNKGYEAAIKDLGQAKKPRRWGLGIQAGGTLNKNITPTPYIGIGVSYNIIRF
jgi:hypothetical protein